jgi:hypothetical protein
MDSRMNLQIAEQRIADLHRAAAASRTVAEVVEAPKEEQTPVIALRLAGPDELDELALLAALDSQRPLSGDSLVALVDGNLIAAMSLRDGRVIADPLAPTDEARALLQTRVAQLRRKPRARRRRRLRLRFA